MKKLRSFYENIIIAVQMKISSAIFIYRRLIEVSMRFMFYTIYIVDVMNIVSTV